MGTLGRRQCGGGPRRARLDRKKGETHRPGWRPAGWTGRRFHLGDNKDAEVYAIYQAFGLSEAREDSNDSSTVISDSTAALSRAQADRTGPGYTAMNTSP